jgi:hypothetical protein
MKKFKSEKGEKQFAFPLFYICSERISPPATAGGTDKGYAVAGLFGVIGGRIGFLNGFFDGSSVSGVPSSSVAEAVASLPSSGRPATTRRI